MKISGLVAVLCCIWLFQDAVATPDLLLVPPVLFGKGLIGAKLKAGKFLLVGGALKKLFLKKKLLFSAIPLEL